MHNLKTSCIYFTSSYIYISLTIFSNLNFDELIFLCFFSCTFARQVWAISRFPSPYGGFDGESVYANISYLISSWRAKKDLKEITKKIPWTLWYLWKNMNSLLFEGWLFDTEQVCSKTEEEA